MRLKNFVKNKNFNTKETSILKSSKRNNITSLIKILTFLLIIILIILAFLNLKISKFVFTFDKRFFEESDFKVFALNNLKDQSLLIYSKGNFENQIKEAFPEINDITYEIFNFDTLKVNFKASDLCCIVSDTNGLLFLISSEGKVLRKISLQTYNKKEVKFEYLGNLEIGYKLNSKVTNRLNDLFVNEFSSEILLDKILFTFDKIILYTKDEVEIVIDENTDLEKFKSQFSEIKKYLESSSKKFSSLDFRFEKVIVK
jgi:hypothetical protein